ncbi:protease inhibitor I42 family protein [Streptomyces sp. NPDC003077]|uniref:protease inhibitor I42 family protein n=1 Tax=Streptomyces sp. NPDC003077 TaxID=3154443 RepID=UPI0033AD7B3B
MTGHRDHRPRRPIRTAAAALCVAALLGGCDFGEAAVYSLDHPDITADEGGRFSLSVSQNPSLGEEWYVVAPSPDPAVVRARGVRAADKDDGLVMVGAGYTRLYDFEAVGQGKTQITLLHCPLNACSGDSTPPSTTPGPHWLPTMPKATHHTYTVTVN